MDPGFLLLAGLIYFVPTINAYARKHKSAGAIFLTNMAVGWTLIGWVVALIWSAGGNTRAGEPTPATHVKCPDCAELVRKEASVCKHCGCRLRPQ